MDVGAGLTMRFMRIFQGRFAVATIALAWICAGSFAASAENVLVQGNKRVDSLTIAAYFSGSDQASVNKGVKDLYATGLFSSIKVSRAGGQVVISVTENNVINRVVFEGNSKVKSETLSAEVQSKSRGPYSQAMVDADIERIKDIYRRAGRAAAKVTARTVDLPNGRLDVVFTIDEGEKTGVKTINFVGNQAYSSGKLRDLMQTTEMNFSLMLQVLGRLRSRPDRVRPRTYPPVLSQERVCRFSRRGLRRSVRPGARRLYRHDHGRGGGAIHRRLGQCGIAFAGPRRSFDAPACASFARRSL